MLKKDDIQLLGNAKFVFDPVYGFYAMKQELVTTDGLLKLAKYDKFKECLDEIAGREVGEDEFFVDFNFYNVIKDTLDMEQKYFLDVHYSSPNNELNDLISECIEKYDINLVPYVPMFSEIMIRELIARENDGYSQKRNEIEEYIDKTICNIAQNNNFDDGIVYDNRKLLQTITEERDDFSIDTSIHKRNIVSFEKAQERELEDDERYI